MVDLMIIYIEKTITKALDIYDIINFLRNVSSMSPNLSINKSLKCDCELDMVKSPKTYR
jgi:hypothetical protein